MIRKKKKKEGSTHRGRVPAMANHMVLGTCIKLAMCLALFFLFGFVLGYYGKKMWHMQCKYEKDFM